MHEEADQEEQVGEIWIPGEQEMRREQKNCIRTKGGKRRMRDTLDKQQESGLLFWNQETDWPHAAHTYSLTDSSDHAPAAPHAT